MSKPLSTLNDLAVFGATPTFSQPLFVGRPNIGNRDQILTQIGEILDSRWLSNRGQFVQEFENRLQNFLGVKHCIAITNGTIALEIVFKALGLEPGDEVIVPAYTFIASAHALEWLGIRPVFADILAHNHCLDPQSVAKQIGPKTKGILGVHLWGHACDINALDSLAQTHQLKLIFDAAHAFGSSYQGQLIGGFGNAEVFSFHATKFVNSFEGGAIATNDDALAERLQQMKNFGFVGFDQVNSLGTNGKMHEASAVMGLASLDHMPQFVAINQQHYQAYHQGFATLKGLDLIAYDTEEQNNYQYIVVEVDPEHWDRDVLMGILQAEQVIVRRYFYPGCHRMAPYHQRQYAEMPMTERACQNVLVFPTGTGVQTGDIARIFEILKFCQQHWSAIKANRTKFVKRKSQNKSKL